jgi:hypothetical protein
MNAGIVTAIAIGIMVLSNGIVGISLLRRAARTRRAPELLIGLGLFMMGPVSQLFTIFAGTGRLPAGEVRPALHAMASLGSASGMSCIFLFVWTVFRPGVGWARVLVALAIGTVVVANVGAFVSMSQAAPETPSRDVLRGWGLAMIAMFTLSFGWAAVESGLYYGASRKRLRLGLSDPVTTNRFLLWAIASASAFLLGICFMKMQIDGMQITGSLVPSLLTMCVSIVTGAGMYLAFLPPRAYLAWVERRASAS